MELRSFRSLLKRLGLSGDLSIADKPELPCHGEPMISEPTIVVRPARPYVGIRSTISMSAFSREISAMTEKVSGWMSAHNFSPSGRPFLRYHAIEMPDRMDVELGIPCDSAEHTEGPVTINMLPAGSYAILTYGGVKNGKSANKKLFDWISNSGERPVSHPSDHGEVFAARYETFLTDAMAEPNQDNWLTEVAVKLRDR